MIERLSGTLVQVLPSGVIVDVNGVGYGVDMPLSSLCQLPEKNLPINLWTYTYVREDALKLFGFLTYEERHHFQILIGLSGVGPKTALNILSHLSVSSIKAAVLQSRPEIFEQVPGVGQRLSEKILLELKAKFKRLIATPKVASEKVGGEIWDDLRSALENLGYKDRQIEPVVAKIAKIGEMPVRRHEAAGHDGASVSVGDLPELIKLALQELRGGGSKTQSAAASPDTDLF